MDMEEEAMATSARTELEVIEADQCRHIYDLNSKGTGRPSPIVRQLPLPPPGIVTSDSQNASSGTRSIEALALAIPLRTCQRTIADEMFEQTPLHDTILVPMGQDGLPSIGVWVEDAEGQVFGGEEDADILVAKLFAGAEERGHAKAFSEADEVVGDDVVVNRIAQLGGEAEERRRRRRKKKTCLITVLFGHYIVHVR